MVYLIPVCLIPESLKFPSGRSGNRRKKFSCIPDRYFIVNDWCKKMSPHTRGKCRLTPGGVRFIACIISGHLIDGMTSVFDVIIRKMVQCQHCGTEPNPTSVDQIIWMFIWGRGASAPRGQITDVNRNVLSLWSSFTSFKS